VYYSHTACTRIGLRLLHTLYGVDCGMISNCELESMRRGATATYFTALYQYSSGGTEENFSRDSQPPGKDVKGGSRRTVLDICSVFSIIYIDVSSVSPTLS
jgi:hypothetical protein